MSSKGKPVRFNFRGGNLALDFMNTVGNRLSETERRDYFRTPEDLVRWAKEAGLSLPRRNDTNGKEHARAKDLEEILAFRETVYRIFLSQVNHKPTSLRDLRCLNDVLLKHRSRMYLSLADGAYRWSAKPTRSFDWVMGQVAESAATLLTSRDLEQLRVCEHENCGWFFLDRSRNVPRRWCSMEDCGNRAKARRHYERLKQS
jgi:predicted RNA-binding Zn ribbon-like protein